MASVRGRGYLRGMDENPYSSPESDQGTSTESPWPRRAVRIVAACFFCPVAWLLTQALLLGAFFPEPNLPWHDWVSAVPATALAAILFWAIVVRAWS